MPPEVVGDRVVVVTQTALSAVAQAAQPAGDEGNQAREEHGWALFFTRRADGQSAIRQAGQPAPHDRPLRDARCGRGRKSFSLPETFR